MTLSIIQSIKNLRAMVKARVASRPQVRDDEGLQFSIRLPDSSRMRCYLPRDSSAMV